ncbi:hypothetical protein ACHAXS_013862, partial [Conticribra weissflogii]
MNTRHEFCPFGKNQRFPIRCRCNVNWTHSEIIISFFTGRPMPTALQFQNA